LALSGMVHIAINVTTIVVAARLLNHMACQYQVYEIEKRLYLELRTF